MGLPLEEGDRVSHISGGADGGIAPIDFRNPEEREAYFRACNQLETTLRHLFNQSGNPMRDSSCINDICAEIVGHDSNGGEMVNRLHAATTDLTQNGVQSDWFQAAMEAKNRIDTKFYLEEGLSSDEDE